MASIEHQMDLLHGFLAQWPCPTGTRVSDHVRREASAGNAAAQRLLKTELFAGSEGEASEQPGPIAALAVQESERPITERRLTADDNLPAPEGKIVHSGEAPLWLLTR